MSALEVTNVSVRYGNIVGTQGVSFKLNAGETIALVGSNGAGKSSTLKAILGLVDYPDAGPCSCALLLWLDQPDTATSCAQLAPGRVDTHGDDGPTLPNCYSATRHALLKMVQAAPQ